MEWGGREGWNWTPRNCSIWGLMGGQWESLKRRGLSWGDSWRNLKWKLLTLEASGTEVLGRTEWEKAFEERSGRTSWLGRVRGCRWRKQSWCSPAPTYTVLSAPDKDSYILSLRNSNDDTNKYRVFLKEKSSLQGGLTRKSLPLDSFLLTVCAGIWARLSSVCYLI